MLYAKPYISPITGALSVRILTATFEHGNLKEEQVDIVAVDGHGTFPDEHHVPINVLSSAFEKRFAGGGRYRQRSEWDYPVLGDQIGCQVERVE